MADGARTLGRDRRPGRASVCFRMSARMPAAFRQTGNYPATGNYRNAARAASGLAPAKTAVTFPLTARTVIRNPSSVRNKYFSV